MDIIIDYITILILWILSSLLSIPILWHLHIQITIKWIFLYNKNGEIYTKYIFLNSVIICKCLYDIYLNIMFMYLTGAVSEGGRGSAPLCASYPSDLLAPLCLSNKVSSSLSHNKTLKLRNFSYFLSSSFIFDLILIKISMNANIMKTQNLSMTSKVIKDHIRSS